jgi:hypothetical protein
LWLQLSYGLLYGRRLAKAPPYNQLSYIDGLIVMGTAVAVLEFGGGGVERRLVKTIIAGGLITGLLTIYSAVRCVAKGNGGALETLFTALAIGAVVFMEELV